MAMSDDLAGSSPARLQKRKHQLTVAFSVFYEEISSAVNESYFACQAVGRWFDPSRFARTVAQWLEQL